MFSANLTPQSPCCRAGPFMGQSRWQAHIGLTDTCHRKRWATNLFTSRLTFYAGDIMFFVFAILPKNAAMDVRSSKLNHCESQESNGHESR
jgi:hypothetical protein